MTAHLIDLYSDTKTRPTPAMLQAMMRADVGDEQHFEDPTVDALVKRAAKLLGQEAALFLPSGTMANEIAVLVHCRPGDELIAHEHSHLLNFEGGAAAALAGVMVRRLTGSRGQFGGSELRAAIRPTARHLPRSRMVAIEQTTNIGGGAVWPIDAVQEICTTAKDAGLALHLDGARLMNAVVESGVSAADYAAPFDTVYLDFTKGLGAPFGAVLAGSRNTIDEAWRWKQRLGGSMRQAGFMAAACLHALDHHVARLAEDHANAQLLAAQLAAIKGLTVEPVETNMVYVDVAGIGLTAQGFNTRLLQHDIRMSIQGPTRLRAVTHLDISSDAILTVGHAARRIVDAL